MRGARKCGITLLEMYLKCIGYRAVRFFFLVLSWIMIEKEKNKKIPAKYKEE